MWITGLHWLATWWPSQLWDRVVCARWRHRGTQHPHQWACFQLGSHDYGMLIQRNNNSFYACKYRFTCMVKLWFILSCIGFHPNWIWISNSKDVYIVGAHFYVLLTLFDMHCWSNFLGMRRWHSFPYVVFTFLNEMSKTIDFYVTLVGFQYFS